MTRKVGIFSGTFDPVHLGHLDFARQALVDGSLDKIFFLVERRPRRKQGIKAFEHRQKMVSLAIQSEPAFGSIVLDQERFTPHETLPVLHARFKGAELQMLMGDDMLSHLGDWPHVDELLRDANFIIGLRQLDQAEAAAKLRALEQSRGLKLRFQMFQSEHSDYASSKIRQAYKQGLPPEGLSRPVRDYIETNGLYAPA